MRPKAQLQLRPMAVSVKIAALLLGVSERSVWKLVERGELPVRKIGRRVVFPTAAINSFLNRREEGTTERRPYRQRE